MTINCKGNLVDLSSPKIMGILNLTPDSFYDGGSYKNDKDILQKVENFLVQGATFIDIGAYSSRPGAQHISTEEELTRLLPILALLEKHFPEIIISVDTFRSEVAAKAIENGAAIINDISAGLMDENMMTTVAQYQVPYIMMHMQGTPQNMQQDPSYNDVTLEVNKYFSAQIFKARQLKINDIIIDPGFGFGKTVAHNYQLLNQLEMLQWHQVPILAGISRKSMIYKVLDTTPNEALNGTSVLHTIALQKGAKILRVHDVKEAQECITLLQQLNQA